MDLLYRGYINTEEYYVEVKGNKVDFGLEVINALYGLDKNEIKHVIFKSLNERNLQEALEKVTWPGTKWDIMPTGKYEASVWLVH